MTNTDVLSANPESANPASADAAPATEAGAPVATEAAKANGTATRRKPAGLSGMVLAELRELAGQLGITGTTGMRKGDLIAAIKERQGSASSRPARKTSDGGQLPFGEESAKASTQVETPSTPPSSAQEPQPTNGASAETAARPAAGEDRRTDSGTDGDGGGQRRRRRPANRQDGDNREGNNNRDNNRDNTRTDNRDNNRADTRTDNRESNRGENNNRENNRGDNNRGDNRGGNNRNNRGDNRGNDRADNNRGDDDDDGGNRRGRRFRDRRRNRNTRTEGGAPDTEIREDDVLLPVAGILDVLENYAFVRTSGYLAGPNDVYVSLSLVRRFGLRRGDAITGVIRQPREGEQNRQKFNPLVRVDTINGVEPDQARKRPDFTKLTPLYPNERLRLETEPHKLTTRVIDLVMPVGKGQRALIVSPPKAGKTTIMQDVANAIATNNPECYLMVVLVDERPEEVTDMQRSIKGEVIASTFDRPPSDHTSVAELAIERAKRLVEMGNDVVVMLDSITRLGRAYNNSSPASGRILSGGVDSTALYPPKRFLGAARNIEHGGSLTIFATAMVETGSTGDTVIFEEFKGTGNAELKLDRKIAERRVFPAVDINPSGTRKDELLLSPDELAVSNKLGRVLHALDSQQAIDTLLHQLRKTKNNVEFLMQISKTTPGMSDD